MGSPDRIRAPTPASKRSSASPTTIGGRPTTSCAWPQEKGPCRVAPCRLCAVHAIELYLNAFLLKLGHPPERIRDSRHDLAARAALANAGGLGLRRRTAIHLAAMTQGREYLVLRYDPGMAELPPLNRLWATLDEIARKVTRAVAIPAA